MCLMVIIINLFLKKIEYHSVIRSILEHIDGLK